MEIKRELKTIEVDFKCPKCDDGRLRTNGIALLTDPIKYEHICNKCFNYTETFNIEYPHIIYEPK